MLHKAALRRQFVYAFPVLTNASCGGRKGAVRDNIEWLAHRFCGFVILSALCTFCLHCIDNQANRACRHHLHTTTRLHFVCTMPALWLAPCQHASGMPKSCYGRQARRSEQQILLPPIVVLPPPRNQHIAELAECRQVQTGGDVIVAVCR